VNNSDETMTDTRSGAVRAAARTVGSIAAAFSLVVALLLGVNAIQNRRASPLHSTGVEHLLEQLKERPDDERLKEQIRAFDLLARQAFFSSRSFARRGAYVLLGGVLVMLAAFHLGREQDSRPPRPGTRPDSGDGQRQGRLMVSAVGVLLVVLAFALAYKTGGDGGKRASGKATEAGNAPPAPAFPSRAEVLQNWPSFRGPDGLGVAYCSKAPIAWDGKTREGIKWTLPIAHPGFGSPVVWGTRLFLSVADEEMLGVLCVDTGSGKTLWEKAVERVPGAPTERPEVTDDTGYAASSMTTDGQRVFAIYATGDVVCFSVEGEQLWARYLGTPENHYGHSSSLIMYRDRLIVQYDQGNKPRLMALDAATGKTVWETPRPVEISWASPAIVTIDSSTQIVLNASPVVASYDVATGQVYI